MARWLHQCLAHRWPRPAGAQLLKRKRKSLGHSGCWWVATSTTQTMSMKRGQRSSCRQLSMHMMSSWVKSGANAGPPGLMMHSSPCSTSRSRLLHCGWNSFVACVLSGGGILGCWLDTLGGMHVAQFACPRLLFHKGPLESSPWKVDPALLGGWSKNKETKTKQKQPYKKKR